MHHRHPSLSSRALDNIVGFCGTRHCEAKTMQPVASEEAVNGGLPSYDEAVDSDSGAAHGEAGLPSYDEAVSSKV